MAFTGDLELLNIVDIIQLLNSTRKSGTFSVKGSRGESRIIFSNGSIVGANHLNSKVRIGTVLVKMNAITREDLQQALSLQKSAGKNRKPLIAMLIEMGKLKSEDAAKGLKKLIEMTIVELVGWTKGTFTLDTEAVVVSPECSYPISTMEQEISLDAQMILMDALRILDERERDRQGGKTVLSDEELYADVISLGESAEIAGKSALTADDLGLGDLDRLERKMPQHLQVQEIFDPLEIHRQKIQETLAAFPAEEQETFVSFLKKFATRGGALSVSPRLEGLAKGLILFSEDEFLKHAVMTICKTEGILVFATDGEEELNLILGQCLIMKVLPVLIFDAPETTNGMLSREKIVNLHQQARTRYPQVPMIQLSSPMDYPFTLQSLHNGIRTVFPKPSREVQKATFVRDAITFLEIFNSYIKGLFLEQRNLSPADIQLSICRDRVLALRNLNEPSEVSLALLHYVSELCGRAITFIVHPTELIGEKAIGVFAEREAGPTSVTRLKVPLTNPSIFRDVVEQGVFFCGESNDEVLKKGLFEGIGEPLSPKIILLPTKIGGKTATLTYGDFGSKEATPVKGHVLEILAQSAGLIVETILCRRQLRGDIS